MPEPVTRWSTYPNAYERALAGRLERHVIVSELLADNPLGDPAERPLEVYVPPGYDEDPQRRYPSIYVIQGYTGAVPMWHNRAPFRPTFPEVVDALFAGGDAPACVIVLVDAWTAYGGSQFVDSPGTGRYHSYLCDEVVPFVDARYRTLAAAAHRGIAGKSSGGFGAMISPMLRPDLFGGLASHAGDALYELAYIQGFGKVVRALRAYDGSYEKFWEDFASRPPMSKDTDGDLVINYGVAAAFSADEDGTVHLPFDLRTGRLVDDVWARWLAWDPVRMVPPTQKPCAVCVRSMSTVAPATSGTWTSGRSPSGMRSPRSASRTSHASSSTQRTAASTIATRAAWPTLRSACRATAELHAQGGAAAPVHRPRPLLAPGEVPRPPDALGHVVLDGADVALGAGVVPAPREPCADRAPEVAGRVARAVARDGVQPGLAAVVVGADDRAPVVGVEGGVMEEPADARAAAAVKGGGPGAGRSCRRCRRRGSCATRSPWPPRRARGRGRGPTSRRPTAGPRRWCRGSGP